MSNKNEGIQINPGEFEKTDLVVKGFNDAANAKGNLAVLEQQLQSIYSGKYIDSNLKTGLSDEEMSNYQNQIDALTNLNSTLNSEIENEDEMIKTRQDQIKDYSSKIDKIKIGEDTGHSPIELFSSAKFIIIAIILVPLTAYLYLFYVSAGLKGFYGNLEQLAEMISSGLSTGGVLPEPAEVASAFQENWLLILIPFIPFAGGLGIHIYLEKEQLEKRVKYLIVGVIVAGIFAFDFFIAYRIFQYTGEAKELMGLATDKWYESTDFRIILIMGFVVFLIWSVLFDAAFSEWNKRNITGRLDDEIRKFKKEIENMKIKRNDPSLQISKNTNEIASIQKKIKVVYVFVSDLEHNISQYFTGWMNFLSGAGYEEKQKKEAQDVVKIYSNPKFKNGRFTY